MKKHYLVVFSLVILMFCSTALFGQDILNKTYVGASVGTGWGDLGFSANFEKIFKELEGFGVVGVGAEVGYVSVSSVWSDHYTYVPILVFGSLHYKLENPKLDPYARLGIGYIYIDWPGPDYFGLNESYVSIAGQVGMRYQMSPKVWLRGALGTPFAISIGADIEL